MLKGWNKAWKDEKPEKAIQNYAYDGILNAFSFYFVCI